MSNNLVSQPLPVPARQMEPVSNQDVSLLNMQMAVTAPVSANRASDFAVSTQQLVPSDAVSYIPGTEDLMISNNPLAPDQKVGAMGSTWNSGGIQKPLLPAKRKAAVESLPDNSLTQQSSVLNKRVAQIEPHVRSGGSSQVSVMNKRHTQVQPLPNTQGSLNSANKKMMRNESMPSKFPRVQTPKSRIGATEVSPKVKTESSEGIRSKMRETLAAALSVGGQNQEKAPNAEKKSPRQGGSVPAQAHLNSQPARSVAPSSEANAAPGGNILKDPAVDDKLEDRGSTPGQAGANEHIRNSDQTGKSDGQEPRYNYVMPDADGSFSDTFFVKDELLQGNGLSWAWDMEVADLKEVQTDEKSNSAPMGLGSNGTEDLEDVNMSRNGTELAVNSPQELAFRIEAELFKLFGGVNKKYKEKGRSLVFNLKDRNNPELREKVISGEISPERLCSMTPEELASKELSEWRMAKAEELDKMIVLPDSDVDVRRLVKKTHKGEYQVEVEQDDGVSVEVSVGSSSFTQFRPKKKKPEVRSSSKADEVKPVENAEAEKSTSENQDPASLTIPADATDFMQELIVDEFKDEGFLPPIVSLDEFMESLNSEPPFENLPVDANETKHHSDKEDPETCGDTGGGKLSSEPTSADTADSVEAEVGVMGQLKVVTEEATAGVITAETSAERKKSSPASAAMGEHVWEGELQLTISSTVTVIGLFRSGEKTSTKEWPRSMEIKGRVRLDAFEKFLQELPMSRSRAVMVVHFVLKDARSETQNASLSEAVESYVADERLGFGEPNPGVELYFCPPRIRIIEMLSRHLSKDQIDIFKSTDNGLIGVVVWRRAHFNSAISPNSSSLHKHNRKHNFSTRRQENVNANMNSSLTPKSSPFGHGQSVVNRRITPQPNNDDDDDDEIPPGFGPGAAARDEDDLPEFNFSGNVTSGQKLPPQGVPGSRMTPSHQSSRPVDQMRQLIYKYGQTGNVTASPNRNGNGGTGTVTRPWAKDDDDDDIPEWQPQLHQNHALQHQLRPHVATQIRQPTVQMTTPIMPLQNQVNMIQNGVRWVQPPGPHGLRPTASVQGQYYVGQWRQDAPRSRGF